MLTALLAALATLVFGTLIVPNAGEGKMLEFILNKSAPANVVLGLYNNNVSLGSGTVLGDLTEVSGGGYANVTLTGASWTVVTGAPSTASYAQQTFTFTSVPGTATVYGYFVKSGTTLLWAEQLPSAPFTIAGAGDEVRVTPQFTLASVSGD